MERLLVTGVDFPLGANLALALSEQFLVRGTCDKAHVECERVRTELCPTSKLTAMRDLIREWQPAWIIHCGPLATGSWDALHAGTADEAALADAPAIAQHVAHCGAEAGARVTVISSDVVFSGPRMFHSEDSPAAADSSRAAHTLRMEQLLAGGGTLVVRTHAYGWSPLASHAGYVERTWEDLRRGRAAGADGCKYATPILASDLAGLLSRAYRLRMEGLYHISGAERASAFRLASELASLGGCGWPRSAAGERAASPADHAETSLSSQRARRVLEAATPLLAEGLSRLIDQDLQGWRDQWHRATRRATDLAA